MGDEAAYRVLASGGEQVVGALGPTSRVPIAPLAPTTKTLSWLPLCRLVARPVDGCLNSAEP